LIMQYAQQSYSNCYVAGSKVKYEPKVPKRLSGSNSQNVIEKLFPRRVTPRGYPLVAERVLFRCTVKRKSSLV